MMGWDYSAEVGSLEGVHQSISGAWVVLFCLDRGMKKAPGLNFPRLQFHLNGGKRKQKMAQRA